MLDTKRLIGEVAAQNGIRLEPDDPAFALVTLNQLILEEAANRLFEQVSTMLTQFNEGLSKGEHLAGKTLAQEVKAAALEVRREWADLRLTRSLARIEVRNIYSSRYLWLIVGVITGVGLAAAGFAIYRLIP